MLESRAKELGLLSDNVWSYIERVGKDNAELRTAFVDMHIARKVAGAAVDNVVKGHKWSDVVRYDDDCYGLSKNQMGLLRFVGIVDNELVAFEGFTSSGEMAVVYPLYEYSYSMSGQLIDQKEAESSTPMFVQREALGKFWLNKRFVSMANAYDRACKGLDEVSVGGKDVYTED